MKISITKYGLPQVLVYPLALVAIMVVLVLLRKGAFSGWVFWTVEFVLLTVLVWQLSFFRDPARAVPAGDDFLISPADGKVTDIQVVDDAEFIGGKATRIGIFLSVFNVHINRMPADVRVEKVVYRPGKFKDARSPECGRVNESSDVYAVMLKEPGYKLIVRQISGAIARRIVTDANVGQEFELGQQYGMIKYGSRTELYLPCDERATIKVKVGDNVKAGLTKLVELSK